MKLEINEKISIPKHLTHSFQKSDAMHCTWKLFLSTIIQWKKIKIHSEEILSSFQIICSHSIPKIRCNAVYLRNLFIIYRTVKEILTFRSFNLSSNPFSPTPFQKSDAIQCTSEICLSSIAHWKNFLKSSHVSIFITTH